MAKIKIDVTQVSQAKKMFETFSYHTIRSTKLSKPISTNDFSNKLREIGDIFIKENQKEGMNRYSKKLAETLVELKNHQLAGRIYSFLIKFNKGNKKLIEEFATNALAIAKRLHDPVHIMARANDLKEIYKYTKPNSDKHLSVLFDEKKALGSIIRDYESAKKRFISTNTAMKPVEKYEEKLAAIKIEIAELLIERGETGAAKIELETALKIYEKFGKGPNTEKAEKLLKEIE